MTQNDCTSRELDSLYRLRFAQRKKLNRELVCLAVFAAEWLMAEDLNLSDLYRRKRCMNKLREILGGPDGPGLLQKRLNQDMDGILERMQDDIGPLKLQEVLVYSLSLSGFTNDLCARVAGLSSPKAVSVIRTRLRERILQSESPFRREYLDLLPLKGCRFGEEMLYLHNLKYQKNGNSEKDQDQGAACRRAGQRSPGQRLGTDQKRQQTGKIHRPQ